MILKALILTAILCSAFCATALAQGEKGAPGRSAPPPSATPTPSGAPPSVNPWGRRERRYAPTSDSPEVGDISDIKEMTAVYVHAEDARARRLLVDELKAYPRLRVVGTVEEAEFLVQYTYRLVTSAATSGSGVTTAKATVDSRTLVVTTTGRLDDERGVVHQRTVWSMREGARATSGMHPARLLVRAFIKDLKKARGED
jgi:hypothetical protein